MIDLASKEKVLKFMLTQEMNIQLSTSDYNVITKILMKSAVTTKQDELIDLLINKYSASIKKAGQDPKQLQKLPWIKKKVIQSDSEYSIPRVSLKGDVMRIYAPFVKSLMAIIKIELTREYEWDPHTKEYYERFTTQRLKHVAGLLARYYHKPPLLCPEITRLIGDADKYSGIYTPTLVKTNGNFFIAGHNEHLEKAIGSMPLNDDPFLLSKLVRHGVAIDSTVHEGNKLKVLASTLITKIDNSELAETVLNLYKIGIRRFCSSQRTVLSEIDNALSSMFDAETFLSSQNDKANTDAVLILNKSLWIAEHSLTLGFYKVVIVQ